MISELIIRKLQWFRTGKYEQRGTFLGSTACAQVELPQGELSRANRMFYGGTGIIANGIAPDTAIPTTTAKLALFNNHSQKSLYIDHLHYSLGSGTPTAGSTLYVAVSRGPLATRPTTNATGYSSSPTNGNPEINSNTFWATSVTMPANTVWASVIGNFQLAAANVGQSDAPHEMRGAICVPPGYALGFSILSGTGTTPLYGVSARWAELEGDIE